MQHINTSHDDGSCEKAKPSLNFCFGRKIHPTYEVGWIIKLFPDKISWMLCDHNTMNLNIQLLYLHQTPGFCYPTLLYEEKPLQKEVLICSLYCMFIPRRVLDTFRYLCPQKKEIVLFLMRIMLWVLHL